MKTIAGPTRMDAAAKAGIPIVGKANACAGRCEILIPKKAISVISAEGQPFYDPAADAALFSAIRDHARVPVIEMEEEINSPAFARACAERLLTYF